ncbi:MAG: hypothetical protein ACOC7J_03320, partial [Armatimonadota bacterium]
MRTLPVAVAACLIAVAPVLAAETGEQPEAPRATADGGDESPASAEAAPSATPDLMSLLNASTADQRGRMFRFIRNRYPGLMADLLAVLQSRRPGIFVAIDAEFQNLVASRYPRMSVTVQRILQTAINERYPQVRNQIAELI